MPSIFSPRPLLLALGFAFALSHAGLASAADPLPKKTKPPQAAKAQAPLSSPELLLRMLLSEIALARGDAQGALYGYSELSKRTDDARIAQRANEIATSNILLGASNNPLEAEAALKAALARPSKARGKLLLQLPAVFARSTDKVAVAKIVERLSAPYLDLPEAHLARAQAEIDAGNLPAANIAANEAVRLQPDLERAALLQAQSAPPEQIAASMEKLGAFGKSHPDALDARTSYARWLAQEKRGSEARLEYQALLKEFPDNEQLSFAIVGLAAQVNDMQTAEEQLSRLIERSSNDNGRLRLLLGEVQAERGRYAEALQTFEAIAPGPNFLSAQTSKARLLAAREQVDTALKSLQDAAVRSPDDLSALQAAQAQLLRQVGRQSEAHQVLQALLTREPDNIDALYDIALLDEQLGRVAEMETRLRRAIALKPDHAHALNALGYSFADRNTRLDEADTLLGRAISLMPEDPAILDSVGWLRFRQGKHELALENLRRAYVRFPDAEIAGHLVEVLWFAGQKDNARQIMSDARKTSPDNAALKALSKRLGL